MDSRLEEIVTELIIQKNLEGYLLANFDLEMVKSLQPVNTAALGYANGRFFIRVCEEFFEKLTQLERVAILRHEIGHYIHTHFSRRGDRDPMLFNVSADMAINQHISNLPDGCMFPLEDMEEKQTAEYYYDELYKQAKKIKVCIGGSGKQGDQTNKSDNKTTVTVMDNIEDIKNESEAAEAEAQAETMIKDTIADRLAAGDDPAHMRGLYGGALEELIKELTKKAIINWRTALSRFVSSFTLHDSSRTLKKPDRRGLSPWGTKKERSPKLIVAIDTSGSVSTELLSKFFGQIRILGMMLSEVRMIECDANVTFDAIYRKGLEKQIQLGYAKGRGGTEFDPVIHLVNKKYKDYDGLVYLTDGYCPPPSLKSKVPILWIVEGNTDFKAKPTVFVNTKR